MEWPSFNRLVVGVCAILLVYTSLKRFGQWPDNEAHPFPPKHYTSRVLYSQSAFIYTAAWLSVYLLIALIPKIWEGIQANFEHWQISNKDPALLAFFLITGISSIPLLRDFDNACKRALYQWASIPDNATRRMRQCTSARVFKPPQEQLHAVLNDWSMATGLDRNAIMQNTTEQADRLRRTLYLIDRLERMATEAPFHGFLQKCTNIDTVKKETTSLLVSTITQTQSPLEQNTLLDDQHFNERIIDILDHLASIACCMVFASQCSERDHCETFRKLGFEIPYTGETVGFSPIVTLGTATVITALVAGAIYHHYAALTVTSPFGSNIYITMLEWAFTAAGYYAGTVFLIHVAHYINERIGRPIRGLSAWVISGLLLGGIAGGVTLVVLGHFLGASWATISYWSIFVAPIAVNGGFIGFYAEKKLSHPGWIAMAVLLQAAASGAAMLGACFVYFQEKKAPPPEFFVTVSVISSAAIGLITGFTVARHRYKEAKRMREVQEESPDPMPMGQQVPV